MKAKNLTYPKENISLKSSRDVYDLYKEDQISYPIPCIVKKDGDIFFAWIAYTSEKGLIVPIFENDRIKIDLKDSKVHVEISIKSMTEQQVFFHGDIPYIVLDDNHKGWHIENLFEVLSERGIFFCNGIYYVIVNDGEKGLCAQNACDILNEDDSFTYKGVDFTIKNGEAIRIEKE